MGSTLSPVYEVGSDEPGSPELTTSQGLTEFLNSLKEGLSQQGLESVWPRIMFVVGNTGTHMKLSYTGKDAQDNNSYAVLQKGFSVDLASQLAGLAQGFNLYPTQHYSDWVPVVQGKDIRRSIVKVNVGPEFDRWRLLGTFDLEEKVNQFLEEKRMTSEKPGYYQSLVEAMNQPQHRGVWEGGFVTDELRARMKDKDFTDLDENLQKELILLRSRYVSAEPHPQQALNNLRNLAVELEITPDPITYVAQFIEKEVFARWDEALKMEGLYRQIQQQLQIQCHQSNGIYRSDEQITHELKSSK